jgi:DNA-directed RNA polymerase
MFLHLDRCLPMIYTPAPWCDYEIGGYYKRPTNLMRIQDSFLQEKCLKYADLDPVYKILNIIGQTTWRINNRVLRVMEAIWEEGGGVGCIPRRHNNLKDYVYPYMIKECRNFK